MRAPRIYNSISSPMGTSSMLPSLPTILGPAGPVPFIFGRGAQEKTLAELKGEFALDVIPTRHYGAQQRLAAAQRPRPQPHQQLPTRHPGDAQTTLPQTH